MQVLAAEIWRYLGMLSVINPPRKTQEMQLYGYQDFNAITTFCYLKDFAYYFPIHFPGKLSSHTAGPGVC